MKERKTADSEFFQCERNIDDVTLDHFNGKKISKFSDNELVEYADAFIFNSFKFILSGRKGKHDAWTSQKQRICSVLNKRIEQYESTKNFSKNLKYFYYTWLRDSIEVMSQTIIGEKASLNKFIINDPALEKTLINQEKEGKFNIWAFENKGRSTWMYLTNLFPNKQYDQHVDGGFIEFTLNENSSADKLTLEPYSFIVVHAAISKKNKYRKYIDFVKEFAKKFIDKDCTVEMYQDGIILDREIGHGCIITTNHKYEYIVDTLNSQQNISYGRIFILSDNQENYPQIYNHYSLYYPTFKVYTFLSSFVNLLPKTKTGNLPNPGKAILLLSVIQLIHNGTICSNKIKPTNELKESYKNNWYKYIHDSKYSPNFFDSFYRLKSKGYWNLYTYEGKEDTAPLQTKQITEDSFSQYDYAIFDQEFYYICTHEWLYDIIIDTFSRIFNLENVSLEDVFLEEEEVPVKIVCKNDQIVYPKKVYLEKESNKIEKQKFYAHTEIEEIILPEGIHTIQNEAFLGCTGLKKIKLPSTLKKIMKSAFEGCVNLTEIELPDKLKYIGEKAFINCSSLKKIKIPSSTEDIDAECFADCNNLEEIIISEGVKTIGSFAFANCGNIDNLIIPKSIEWIGDSPFLDCESIKTLTFAEGNTTCYCNPYKGLNGPSTINIPSTCSYISTPYVISLMNIKNMNIDKQNNTYIIDDGILYNRRKNELVNCNKDKKEVIVRQGTKTIGEYSFARCKNLEKVFLPSSIIKIDERAFQTCPKMRIIEVDNQRVFDLTTDFFKEKKSINIILK